MSALLRLRVSPEGGEPFVVDVSTRDMLIWERSGRDRSYAQLMRQQDMVPMYEIAHLAARRLGLFSESLAAFESTCDIEPVEDEDTREADTPTRPARSTARRSRSR